MNELIDMDVDVDVLYFDVDVNFIFTDGFWRDKVDFLYFCAEDIVFL